MTDAQLTQLIGQNWSYGSLGRYPYYNASNPYVLRAYEIQGENINYIGDGQGPLTILDNYPNYKARVSGCVMAVTTTRYEMDDYYWCDMTITAYRDLWNGQNLNNAQAWLRLNITLGDNDVVCWDSSQFQQSAGSGYVSWLSRDGREFESQQLYNWTYKPVSYLLHNAITDSDYVVPIVPQQNPYGEDFVTFNSCLWSYTLTIKTADPLNDDLDVGLSLYGSNSFISATSYASGYQSGYQKGYTDGTQTADGNLGGAFTLIGGAFTSISSLMDTQVIGGLTIGALVGIPLCMVAIVAIFRMLKK